MLSSTKVLVDSLLNSCKTTEDTHGIDEIAPSPSLPILRLTAGILRISKDAIPNSVDSSVSVGLSITALKRLSISSGSLILIKNVDANISRIGQAVVLDPPYLEDKSLEGRLVCMHAPRTMLVFPSYSYPGNQSTTLDTQVAYLSPILAFNLSMHISCLKSVVQQGKETLSSLFQVNENNSKNVKENEPSSVSIGLQPWAELPKYASHLRASFVKIPDCGTLERLKTPSSDDAKDRQDLIDLALNDYLLWIDILPGVTFSVYA